MEQGIISPVQGKGYFVSSVDCDSENRVFLFFDALSAYKEVIYDALKDRFGDEAFIDIYYHHFNFRMFEKLIRESAGNYQSYIIIPIENERLDEVLGLLPPEKLYLLDIKPECSSKSYPDVFQNFESDIFQALLGVTDLCRKYSKLILVFRNQITDPPAGLIKGFRRFCKENNIDNLIIRTLLAKRKKEKPTKPKTNEPII